MQFEIDVTEEAEADLDIIRPYHRRQILDEMERHLRFAPTKEIRSRIKRLQLLDSPGYRLRIGEFRIFYDVDQAEAVVTVLRVLGKEASLAYLEDMEGAS
jgi:mRNA-degrading endonuclease RelE of RelBE toxin-antitoxin system